MVHLRQLLHRSNHRWGFLLGAGMLLIYVGMFLNVQTAFTQSQSDPGAANRLFLPIVRNGQSGPTKVTAAAMECIIDTGGANDPEGDGQKDLTQMCLDTATASSGTITVQWSWDEPSLSGNNTLDACTLFDKDNDGNANGAVCLTVNTNNNNPTVQTRVYSCIGDFRPDRCISRVLVSGTTSSCSVASANTDPFLAGDGYPEDLVATCTVVLPEINSGALLDVCSYSSDQANSETKECVIFQANKGKLEVIKQLIPASDAGQFNLQIDGVTYQTGGNNATTGERIVTAGDHTVGELGAGSTNLADYTTALECRTANGTGNVVATGTGSSLIVPVASDNSVADDIVCTITNTLIAAPTETPTTIPTVPPVNTSTETPTTIPTLPPVNTSTETPTTIPTVPPINTPTETPTETPTDIPTVPPVNTPTETPTGIPTVPPVNTPTETPDCQIICTYLTPTATKTPGPTSTPKPPTPLPPTPTMTPTVVLSGGEITIIKNARPNSTRNFRFAGSFGEFFLDDPDTDDGDSYHGNRTFNVLPGEFTVQEKLSGGWTLSRIDCSVTGSAMVIRQLASQQVVINVTGASRVICVFTNDAPTTGDVIAKKYYDANCNGFYDTGDYWLANWKMTVYTAAHTPIASALTNQSGETTFPDLAPGDYVVCEEQQAGWTNSQPSIFGYNAPDIGQPCYKFDLDAGDVAKVKFGNFNHPAVLSASVATAQEGVVKYSRLQESTEQEAEMRLLQQIFLPIMMH